MTTKSIRLGTRGSRLALWQAEWVAARLCESGVTVELIRITTSGDVASGPLGSTGEQGLFTKEIQKALQENRIDLAVHSLKDLPTEPVAGLRLAAVPEREACGDVLVSNLAKSIRDLPLHATVGTGSLRRKAQLLHLRPDLKISDIRGNVETRLRKLDDGEFQALVLAEAGLKRLSLDDRISARFTMSEMLPSIGQGALGLETRSDDSTTQAALIPLDHFSSHAAVLAERALLAGLRGGCLAPIGAWARLENDRLQLDAVVLSADGRQRLVCKMDDSPEKSLELGRAAAESLLAQGAAQLISESRAPFAG